MGIALLFGLILIVGGLAYGVLGLIIAFRTKNPVVRWGIGITAALTLFFLVAGAIFLFRGQLL